jgi:hypothetical protein
MGTQKDELLKDWESELLKRNANSNVTGALATELFVCKQGTVRDKNDPATFTVRQPRSC